MSLPPMTHEEAKDFISLLSDPRFEDFMKRMERVEKDIRDEILHPETESARREALVSMRDIFQYEILDLAKTATKVLQNAGQAQAPAKVQLGRTSHTSDPV